MTQPDDYEGTGNAERDVAAAMLQSQDNFDRQVSNPLRDLVDVAGEKDFTPERLRYFKDGDRVFLQYGADATFSETNQGYLLQPAPDQTLTLRTAEKPAYQVGYDLWPTQARRAIGTLQSGDVVGGGYGRIDLANFDPDAISYSGTIADGYFWYHTPNTGLDRVVLAEVQTGTVLDSRTVDLGVGADVFSILEKRLNCYAVGPAVTRNIFTDIENNPLDPQINEVIGAVANDDGKGPSEFSHRATFAIHQAAGNSGLELEAGSVAVRAPAEAEPQFKSKGHSMDLDASNPTETYQVAAAMRVDPDRENVKLRINDLQITSTPGSNITDTAVLMMAVDPANTNAPGSGAWNTPVEHNSTNSVLQEVVVDQDATTPLTGPIENDADTDSTGAATGNSMDNPGGYQLGRDGITTDKKASRSAPKTGNRELYPGDICLLLVDVAAPGTVEVDVQTEQNS
jgi:archaellin